MEGSHTGQYLDSTFMAMPEERQISRERVFMILRDSGTNTVKRMNLVEFPNLSCFAHTLQSVVNDGLQVKRAVIDAVTKLRKSPLILIYQ